jgi:hypothetical protein
LNSFFVNINLIQNIAKSIISIKIREENTKFTTFHIKSFISFKLIHNELKNITSSTFCAFITINVINEEDRINIIKANAHVKVNISFIEAFVLTFNFALKIIFSQKLSGIVDTFIS